MLNDRQLRLAARAIEGARGERLGEIAVRLGYLSAAQLEAVLAEPRDEPLGAVLVRRRILTDSQLAEILRTQIADLAGGTPPEVVDARRDPIRRLGRYALVAQVGEGGMGEVWKAWDEQIHRWVAVKILRDSNEQVRKRFAREAQISGNLRHPGFVSVHDTGERDGRPYLVMEFIEGSPLDTSAPLRPNLERLHKVCEALEAAHQAGIVHRDLKPGNILVDAAGLPRVVDFGLAHLDDPHQRVTRTGMVMGTPLYMAPEQVSPTAGAITPRTDVYALGVLLYEMIMKRPPHEARSATEVYQKILSEEPAPPRLGPPDLQAVCLRALEKDPARRYSSAGALAKDLARYLAGEPVEARPVSQFRRWVRRSRRHFAIGAAVAAVAIALAILWPRPVAPPPAPKEDPEARKKALALAEAARRALDEANLLLYRDTTRRSHLKERADKALPLLEEAAHLAPDLAVVHHLIGRAHAMAGDRARARAAWDRALEADPNYAVSRLEIARLLLDEAYLASIADPSQPIDSMGLQRIVEEAADQIRQARASLQGVEDEFEVALAVALEAYASLHRANLEEAARTGITRFAERAGVEEFHWLLALAQTGEERIRHASDAIAKRPFYPMAHLTKVIALSRLGRRDDALAEVDRVILLDPGFGPAHYQRGLLREGPEGGDDFARCIELGWKVADARVNRAGRIFATKPDEALQLCDLAISEKPGLGLAYYHRGNAWRTKGDKERAVSDYTRAIEYEPGLGEAWNNRGALRMEAGLYGAAKTDLDQACELRPNNAQAFRNRGVLKNAISGPREGLADLDRAIEIDPKYVRARIDRAGFRRALGDAKGAREDLLAASRLVAPGSALDREIREALSK